MLSLVLRPSGVNEPPGKEWSLQIRDYACQGINPDYHTICRVSREMADTIIEAGTPYWLFGEPDQYAARPAFHLSAALRDVAAERLRQISKEGWSHEHDDGHPDGELEQAAACYSIGTYVIGGQLVWPWEMKWWKPGERRRMLVKAGALILAAIERLDRTDKAKHG